MIKLLLRFISIGFLALQGLHLNAAGFAIQGNIKGADKIWIYLEYLGDNNKQVTDSAYVLRGKFLLVSNIETPTFAIFYAPAMHRQESFFFAPGTTYVDGDTISSHALIFSGDSSTDLFGAYHHKADSFNHYRKSLEPFISGEKAIKDSTLHAKYMDDFYLSMSDEESFTEQFVRKHPASYVSAYLLYYKFSGESNINKGMALVHVLSEPVQQSKYIRLLQQKQAALQSSVAGKPAPDFAEADTSGKMLRLSDIKAQYILLDFWASWCGPCRRESPGLVSAYQKFHAKGFEIISLSFDQNKQAWLNAIHKDNLHWPNVCNFKGWDDETAQHYGVTEIPTNFLIDKNGVIVAKNLLGIGLDDELGRLLGE